MILDPHPAVLRNYFQLYVQGTYVEIKPGAATCKALNHTIFPVKGFSFSIVTRWSLVSPEKSRKIS